MILDNINKSKTIQDVTELLESYRMLKTISVKQYQSKITTSFSLEPKNFSNQTDSPVENHIVEKVLAEEVVKEVEFAIDSLDNKLLRDCLYYKYVHSSNYTDLYIYNYLKLSKSEYYRRLNNAKLEFAKMYKAGKLLTMKDNSCMIDVLKRW